MASTLRFWETADADADARAEDDAWVEFVCSGARVRDGSCWVVLDRPLVGLGGGAIGNGPWPDDDESDPGRPSGIDSRRRCCCCCCCCCCEKGNGNGVLCPLPMDIGRTGTYPPLLLNRRRFGSGERGVTTPSSSRCSRRLASCRTPIPPPCSCVAAARCRVIGPAAVFGVPMSWRKRPGLDDEDGVGGGRLEKGLGVSGVDMLGVVMLRPPHLAHLGVSLLADEDVADGRELVALLFRPFRRGWHREKPSATAWPK